MTARRALLNAGFVVAKPETEESFDVVFRDPITWTWETAQIKTIKIRTDRNNELVVYSRKGDGTPYSRSEAGYIIGVLGDRVYMFENEEHGEYWCSSETRAAERWLELPTQLDRAAYTLLTPAGPVDLAVDSVR